MNIGIIGTGFGKTIAQNFKSVDPATKIFFAGLHPEKIKKIAEEISADGTFPTWQELVNNSAIDLVVIASPSHLHREMFEYASRARKNILVEKPAATSVADISSMERLSQKTGKLSVVNHEGRFHPITHYLKNLIDSGQIGVPLTIRIGAYLNLFSRPDYMGHWYNFNKSGGGQILAMGTHQIDLARFILGMPKITSGSVQTRIFKDPRFKKSPDAESQLSAHFLTAKETSIQLFNDCYCFGYKDFTIELIGNRGIALYSDSRGLRFSYSNLIPPESVSWTDPLPGINLGDSILTKSMKYIAKALIEAIKTSKTNPDFCSLKQAKENLEYFEKYII